MLNMDKADSLTLLVSSANPGKTPCITFEHEDADGTVTDCDRYSELEINSATVYNDDGSKEFFKFKNGSWSFVGNKL